MLILRKSPTLDIFQRVSIKLNKCVITGKSSLKSLRGMSQVQSHQILPQIPLLRRQLV